MFFSLECNQTWQLQHFRMAERLDYVVVPLAPVLLHGPTRKLEVLGDAFVAFAVVDQLNDVTNFIISLLLEEFDLITCAQLLRDIIC